MKVLVTGSEGFIGRYLVDELLAKNYSVVGIDNLSRHKSKKNYPSNSKYQFVKGDVKNTKLLKNLLADCDHLVLLAALVGGVDYFHKVPYDILAENEKITISTFEAAIHAHKKNKLKKITVLSSGMVFESTSIFPTPETALCKSPPPKTTYGFQKLISEYFCRSAWDQYKLPYTIIRPANVVGVGEVGHVIFDLTQKILKGQYPLHILGSGKQIRHFIYTKDLVCGIILSLSSKKAVNQDFNFASNTPVIILELAKIIWRKINPDKPFKYICDDPFAFDVVKSNPDVTKAQQLLGFSAKTNLNSILDEVIPWIKIQKYTSPAAKAV